VTMRAATGNGKGSGTVPAHMPIEPWTVPTRTLTLYVPGANVARVSAGNFRVSMAESPGAMSSSAPPGGQPTTPMYGCVPEESGKMRTANGHASLTTACRCVVVWLWSATDIHRSKGSPTTPSANVQAATSSVGGASLRPLSVGLSPLHARVQRTTNAPIDLRIATPSDTSELTNESYAVVTVEEGL